MDNKETMKKTFVNFKKLTCDKIMEDNPDWEEIDFNIYRIKNLEKKINNII